MDFLVYLSLLFAVVTIAVILYSLYGWNKQLPLDEDEEDAANTIDPNARIVRRYQATSHDSLSAETRLPETGGMSRDDSLPQ